MLLKHDKVKFQLYNSIGWSIHNDQWNWSTNSKNNKKNIKTTKFEGPQLDFLYLKI
jgi:hypothetical protein